MGREKRNLRKRRELQGSLNQAFNSFNKVTPSLVWIQSVHGRLKIHMEACLILLLVTLQCSGRIGLAPKLILIVKSVVWKGSLRYLSTPNVVPL